MRILNFKRPVKHNCSVFSRSRLPSEPLLSFTGRKFGMQLINYLFSFIVYKVVHFLLADEKERMFDLIVCKPSTNVYLFKILHSI